MTHHGMARNVTLPHPSRVTMLWSILHAHLRDQHYPKAVPDLYFTWILPVVLPMEKVQKGDHRHNG